MVRYPLITSKDFYKKINNIYSEYKLYKTNKTAKELCFPKKYKLQNIVEYGLD